MDGSTIAWHGVQPYAADWSDESRLVAWTLADGQGGGLYIAFNSSYRPTTLELPHWHGRSWQLVSDTGKARCRRHSSASAASSDRCHSLAETPQLCRLSCCLLGSASSYRRRNAHGRQHRSAALNICMETTTCSMMLLRGMPQRLQARRALCSHAMKACR